MNIKEINNKRIHSTNEATTKKEKKQKVDLQSNIGASRIEGAINTLKDNRNIIHKDIDVIQDVDVKLNEREISYGPFVGKDIALLIAQQCPRECLALNTRFRNLFPELQNQLRVVFDCSDFSPEKIDFVRNNKLKINITNDDDEGDFFDFTEKNEDLISYIEILHLENTACNSAMKEILSRCSSLTSYSCEDFYTVEEITFPDSLISLTITTSQVYGAVTLNLPGSMKTLKIGQPNSNILLRYRDIEEKDLTTIRIDGLIIPIPKGVTTFHTSGFCHPKISLPENIINYCDQMPYFS